MADDNTKPADTFSDDAPPPETTFEPDLPLEGDVDFESAADDDGAKDDAPASTSNATVQSLKENAAKLTRGVGDKARTYAEDGKARAGGALDELAQMMHDAAGTVDEKVGAQYGQYARTAADAVTGFSESVKAKNIDDLIADATGFVKKSPAIAIGAAAAVGFVLIRLVQSGLSASTDEDA